MIDNDFRFQFQPYALERNLFILCNPCMNGQEEHSKLLEPLTPTEIMNDDNDDKDDHHGNGDNPLRTTYCISCVHLPYFVQIGGKLPYNNIYTYIHPCSHINHMYANVIYIYIYIIYVYHICLLLCIHIYILCMYVYIYIHIS